jgi:formylglycine-generating enzyme required for sulfatase activity
MSIPRRFALICLFAVLAVGVSYSQWIQSNTGLVYSHVYALAVSGQNLFAGTLVGNSVYLSTNNGTSWSAANVGLPTNSAVTALASSGVNLFAATGSGVFLSTNSGAIWNQANSGLTSTEFQTLGVSGMSIFAGTWRSGAFCSTDNGTSWSAVSGLSSICVQAFAVSGTNLFAGTYGGVSLSTDNGTSWTSVNSGLTNTNVRVLAASGANLFAGTDRGGGSGVFLSTNNGTSWAAASTGLTNTTVNALAVSGTNLFAGTIGGGVFLSTDNGTSWNAVNTGLTDRIVYSLAVSGTDLFAGIQGSGVWRRPLSEMNPVQPPDAPSAIAGTNASTSGFTANWSPASGATSYRLDVATDNGFVSFVSGFSNVDVGNVTSFAVAGLTPNTPYYYRVRATNTGGTSGNSNVVSVTTLTANYGLIFVEGGTFQMGSTDGVYGGRETPVHAVTVSSLYLDATEVTVAQYRAFCTATARSMPSAPYWGWTENNPIVNVSWNDAMAYATWAGKRLPTEAEWEYAARGGTLTHGYTYSGSNTIGDVAWYYPISEIRTQAVGTKTPNELGLYDMSGNVWEWCSDWFDAEYYSVSPSVDPKGPSTGTYRVLRGGSWVNIEISCPVFRRYENAPTDISIRNGFRCAKDYAVPGVPSAVAATDITTSTFTANWSATAGATGYRLDVATDNGFVSLVSGYSNVDVGSVTSYTVMELTPNTPYYYRVRAANTAGSGDNSNAISVSTLGTVPQNGTVAGRVVANGHGLAGVAVNLQGEAGLPEPGFEVQLTDVAGRYTFQAIPPDDYQVMIVDPLGYSADQNPKVVAVISNATSTVDFTLTWMVRRDKAEKWSYWKNQFDKVIRGKKTEETPQNLTSYIATIQEHYTPHFNLFAFTDFDRWQHILSKPSHPTKRDEALAEVAALVLNVGSLKLGQYAIITEDHRTVGDVLAYVSTLLANPLSTNKELQHVRQLAAKANHGDCEKIEEGEIPASNVLYKGSVKDFNWGFDIPNSYALCSNYPNPFNPTTTIQYDLPKAGYVSLKVYDYLGKEVASLTSEEKPAGRHAIQFNATNLSSGVYFYRLQAGAFVGTKRLLLLR